MSITNSAPNMPSFMTHMLCYLLQYNVEANFLRHFFSFCVLVIALPNQIHVTNLAYDPPNSQCIRPQMFACLS